MHAAILRSIAQYCPQLRYFNFHDGNPTVEVQEGLRAVLARCNLITTLGIARESVLHDRAHSVLHDSALQSVCFMIVLHCVSRLRSTVRVLYDRALLCASSGLQFYVYSLLDLPKRYSNSIL